TGAATTSFVEAGLSSLDMMDFALEVNRRFGLNLSVGDCFHHRDVASLARAIERTDQPPARSAAIPDDHPAGASDTCPLSTRQVAYLATCMADGNADWCNISREVPLDRVVAVAEVAAAIEALIARHDVLRLALSPDWSRQVHTEAGRRRRRATPRTGADSCAAPNRSSCPGRSAPGRRRGSCCRGRSGSPAPGPPTASRRRPASRSSRSCWPPTTSRLRRPSGGTRWRSS